mgnify:CR=1 FL=1
MPRIAIDAMGGDSYPNINILGSIDAINEFDIHVILVGQKEVLEKIMKNTPNWPSDKISIVDAPEIVEMAESPSKSFRKKKDSSIQVGLRLVKEKKADGFVSAGNTGAVFTAGTLILGRMESVERPALASIFPSEKNESVAASPLSWSSAL